MNRILIIDDDGGFQIVIGKHLTDLGYAVSFASNGWEGLASLDKQLAELIILDAVMSGMDGPTFLRILRDDVSRQKLPVILITAHDPLDVKTSIGQDEVAATLYKGQKEFLPKLAAAVGRILPKS